MNVPLKPWLYRLAGLLVSVFFLYLAVRGVDLLESLRTLGTARLPLLCAAMAVYLLGLPVRASRWRLILHEQKALSLREVLVPTIVGHMANNVLPARAGELYRAHFLGRRVGASRSGVVGSIVVERAFDGLMLVGVMLLVVVLFPGEHFIGAAALLVALFFVGLAAGIFLYGRRPEAAHRGVEAGLRLLPQSLQGFVGPRLDLFLRGVGGFMRTGGYAGILLSTGLIWVIEASAIALVVVSFGVYLPVGGYLLVFALAALGTTLPSGPGYVGPYQYAFVLGLGFFAVSRETALAVSVAAQLSLLGSVTVIGLALLWRENLRPAPPSAGAREREEAKAGEGVG